MRKQFSERQPIEPFPVFHNKYRHFGLAKFRHYLPADSAGRESRFRFAVLPAADGNKFEFPLTFTYRLEDRGAFGAACRCIGSAFDVAAFVYFSVRGHDRGSDGKMRIWHVSRLLCFKRRLAYGFFLGGGSGDIAPESGPVAAVGNTEIFRDRGGYIAKAFSRAEIDRSDRFAVNHKRDMLARVVGMVVAGITAVVGGDEQNVFFAHTADKSFKP